MKPLRVLMVAGGFPLESETFIREQGVQLLERGVELDVLALRPGDGTWSPRDVEHGLPSCVLQANIDRSLLSRLLRSPGRLAALMFRSPGVARRSISPSLGWRATSGQLLEIARALGGPRRYDAIHCQFGPMGRIMLPVLEAGLVSGPLSVAFYGYDITRELQKHGDDVYREMFRRAAILLPNSEYLASRLRGVGAPEEKVHLLRLGIRLDDFPVVDRTARSGRPVALAVGRFVEKKGFEYLVRAMAAAGDRSRFRLVLVGDGPLRAGIEALCRELGIEDRVEFAGWLDHGEVQRRMAESDLFVAPSVTAADGDMEGMPLVVAEAIATGLPVLGTRHSGIPEAVQEGRNGILVEERDVAGLASALVELSDVGRRREAGMESRAIAEAEFNTAIQGDRLLRILQTLST